MTSIPLARAGLTGAGLLLATWLPGWAAAAGLNDTGITQCADATHNNLTCPQAGFPSQDAETGRGAQKDLIKVGGGSAGFDFTKLDSDGHPLPASATVWNCVRDNVTGLVWEVKTDNATPDLRDKDWTYTWCNNDPATNGGSAGMCDTGSGVGSDNCFNNARCDTEKFVQDVNALNPKLCGFSDWRVPTLEELRSLVDYSVYDPSNANPTIDINYFPNTRPYLYWSSSLDAPSTGVAKVVNFTEGSQGISNEGSDWAVRLVRGGQ